MVIHISLSFSFNHDSRGHTDRENLYMVAQLLDTDDLTGPLTTDKNRAFLLLQNKVRLLVRMLPMLNKLVHQTTMAFTLFLID
jgi:hypothetical protein